MKRLFFLFFVLCTTTQFASAEIPDAKLRQVNFEQKPGASISPNLQFRDESGRIVKLGDYLGRKPVILVPGYYGCPMLCTLVLNGLSETLLDLKTSVGPDFEVVNFSIDPSETPALAAAKEKNCLRSYGRPGAEQGWHFLTGDEAAIRQLCDEIGFSYAYDPQIKQYAHPSGFVVITPQGKIARYFMGVDYSARDLDASLTAASSNHTGSPVRQMLLLCFHYNPVTGKYGGLIINTVRACGILTLAGLGLFIARAVRHRQQKT